ncbi:uncharacterized protein LOC109906877 [Oncorhynchus kisutch]|uniref:uncharacterized protein LOC109906877 n=1 Tax=Oncorhynchus kisutch TaxID=8019 RepID=UPI0012DF8F36|nr:uncharacterized protein LOC109906877 [Oncorhynchus kisutch]
MSKLICVALLLVFLVSIWCHNTVSSTKWSVRDVLRKCRCKVLPNGREICRKPLFPKTPEETKQLIKCFCRKYNLYKHGAKLNLETKRDLEKCSFIWSNPF